ncbi:MAG TPA: magnesium transporter CorA family protein, partial [Terriglobales bacterium]|nr:magnesium transporter CorA family protein [Terriglobales bacterium]
MSAQQPCPHLAWFDVADPNSAELDELARRYRLHELQIEDCRHRPQRAKAEEHDSYLFCVLKEMCPEQAISFRDLDVFYGKDYLITVHEGPSTALHKARECAMQEKLQRLDRLFYLIVDSVVDEYHSRLDELSDATSEIESEVLHRPDPPMLRRIFELKRNLIEFRRISSAMREVANAILRREGGLVGDDLDPYFRDVYDHLVRTVDLIETYRDLLTGALDI